MKGFALLKKVYMFLFLTYTFIGSVVYAQVTAPTEPVKIPNPITATDFEVVIQNILDKLIQFGTLLLAVMIVWTGFLFVRSAGAPEGLATAKKSLVATIIGGAIILGALGLSELVVDTVG